MSETYNMPYLNEKRYCPYELAKADARQDAKTFRELWNDNGEYMSRDLANYMSPAPSPVTCRKYMNGGTFDAKHRSIKAIYYAIERKRRDELRREKQQSILTEITKTKAKLQALEAARQSL